MVRGVNNGCFTRVRKEIASLASCQDDKSKGSDTHSPLRDNLTISILDGSIWREIPRESIEDKKCCRTCKKMQYATYNQFALTHDNYNTRS